MSSDLDRAIDVNGRAALRNYSFAFFFVVVATISSVASSILAFLKFDSILVGAIALVPALCTIVLNQLKFQERANWFYRKRDQLYAIANELHFELPDPPQSPHIAELSRRWSALNIAMSENWEKQLSLGVIPPKDPGKSTPS
ncbi:hypothetical protein ATE62_02850 [Sphingopyxis sp. HIX]|nr:hypothetical protein ATE62_02850 [Sphingopyxis sp. HIX]KTE84730.1 hypothetical protein ATE72_07500 [Sphingopyxis sp. HXXIV]